MACFVSSGYLLLRYMEQFRFLPLSCREIGKKIPHKSRDSMALFKSRAGKTG